MKRATENAAQTTFVAKTVFFYLDLVPVSDLTVVIQSIELYLHDVTQIMTLCTTISSSYLISRFWLSQGDDDTQIFQIVWVFVQYCHFSV